MDVSDVKGLFAEVKKRMDGQIEHVRRELTGVRTGRASVTILDTVHVDAYGASRTAVLRVIAQSAKGSLKRFADAFKLRGTD